MSEIEEKLGQHTEISNGRHLDCEALKSREQAMQFNWIIAKSDARPKIYVRYFPHGLEKRISHPTFAAHASKLPREAKTGTETTAGTEYVCVRRLWA